MTTRRALPVLSSSILATLLVLLTGLLVVGPAQAASCTATVHIGGTLVGVELDPSSVAVRKGACVAFVNDLAVPVDVHVDPGFDRQVPPGGSVSYPAKRVGAHDMSAGTLVSRDSGRVTVRRAATPRPSATSSSPSPTRSSPPRSESPDPGTGGSGPRVAPSPDFSTFPTPARTTNPTGTPPSVASVTPFPNSPAPSPSATTVIAGPIEPASGRGTGLPAAVAALSIVGAGAGIVRVLMAEPVDDLPTVGGRA